MGDEKLSESNPGTGYFSDFPSFAVRPGVRCLKSHLLASDAALSPNTLRLVFPRQRLVNFPLCQILDDCSPFSGNHARKFDGILSSAILSVDLFAFPSLD